MTYIIFKMKRDRIAALLQSYDHHAGILKSTGHVPTGLLPMFFTQLDRILYEQKERPFDGTKREGYQRKIEL
jgi:hypothetical protein